MNDDRIDWQHIAEESDRALIKASAEREELRECIALASHLVRRIGTVDANSADNIRRAERWLALAGPLIAKTAPPK